MYYCATTSYWISSRKGTSKKNTWYCPWDTVCVEHWAAELLRPSSCSAAFGLFKILLRLVYHTKKPANLIRLEFWLTKACIRNLSFVALLNVCVQSYCRLGFGCYQTGLEKCCRHIDRVISQIASSLYVKKRTILSGKLMKKMFCSSSEKAVLPFYFVGKVSWEAVLCPFFFHAASWEADLWIFTLSQTTSVMICNFKSI